MKIDGQKITRVYTLKSIYDNNCFGAVLDDGTECRIKISEVLKMLNDFVFIPEKKIKHTYLKIEEEK